MIELETKLYLLYNLNRASEYRSVINILHVSLIIMNGQDKFNPFKHNKILHHCIFPQTPLHKLQFNSGVSFLQAKVWIFQYPIKVSTWPYYYSLQRGFLSVPQTPFDQSSSVNLLLIFVSDGVWLWFLLLIFSLMFLCLPCRHWQYFVCKA